MIKNYFKDFKKIEVIFLVLGSIIIILNGLIFKSNFITILASVVSINAALSLAKRKVIGQILGVIYTLTYAYVSYSNQYFGEMLVNLAFSFPMYLYGVFSWKKHKIKNRDTVSLNKVTIKEIVILFLTDIILFMGLYQLLKYFNTSQLELSTISMIINLSATYLLVRRSKYSYILYMMNSVLLFILWGNNFLTGDHGVIPIMINMSLLLLNNIYGFYNWNKNE